MFGKSKKSSDEMLAEARSLILNKMEELHRAAGNNVIIGIGRNAKTLDELIEERIAARKEFKTFPLHTIPIQAMDQPARWECPVCLTFHGRIDRSHMNFRGCRGYVAIELHCEECGHHFFHRVISPLEEKSDDKP